MGPLNALNERVRSLESEKMRMAVSLSNEITENMRLRVENLSMKDKVTVANADERAIRAMVSNQTPEEGDVCFLAYLVQSYFVTRTVHSEAEQRVAVLEESLIQGGKLIVEAEKRATAVANRAEQVQGENAKLKSLLERTTQDAQELAEELDRCRLLVRHGPL